MKKTIVLMFVLLMLVATCVATPAIEKLEINNDKISADGVDTFDIQLGSMLDIKVRLVGVGDNQDVKVRAEILGYEHGDLTDSLEVFDLDDGDSTSKTMSIEIPNRMDKQHYDLRIYIGTREGVTFEETYQIDIEGDRHSLVIRDVSVSTIKGDVIVNDFISSGTTMFVSGILENIGEKDEDVKVKAELIGLGSDSVYLDDVDADDKVVFESLVLRLPKCAEGLYTLKVSAFYNDLEDVVSTTQTLNVVEDVNCNVVSQPHIILMRDYVDDKVEPVEEEVSSQSSAIRGLEIGLVVLVVLLVILGLVIGFMKLMGNEPREEEVGQTYY